MTDARDRLLAWLHDPPDKPLKIKGHEARAARYLSRALGVEVPVEELRGHGGDQRASAAERLPMPRWDASNRATLVDAEQLLIRHPLSAEALAKTLVPWQTTIDEQTISDTIARLVDGIDSTEHRWLVLWRFLPEELERVQPGSMLLPADTRIPDHTIWQHLDTAVAMEVAHDDRDGPAFLSFSVGPVQSFIASARSVRDLWSGSMILSWLAFAAATPLIEALGPTALVYPSLRGNPFFDLWLREEPELVARVPLPAALQRMTPCLPNRFIALVPGSSAEELAKTCIAQARDAWFEIAEHVHDKIEEVAATFDANWDRFWRQPIEDQFDFRTAVLPWKSCPDPVLARLLCNDDRFDHAFATTARVRSLAQLIPKGDQVGHGGSVVGQWQHRLALLGRMTEVDKLARSVPRPASVASGERVPPMCALTGASEQIGPAGLAEAAEFWDSLADELSIGGVRLRRGERLGPVALVKRFCGPAWFAGELELSDARQLRFDDTATVAAAYWLDEARKRNDGFDYRQWQSDGNWSGQWLHHVAGKGTGEEAEDRCPGELAETIRRLRSSDALGAPPAYYAVLALDGDRLGEWLQGRLSCRVGDLLHPNVRDYFESLPQQAGQDSSGLEQPRPVTPAFHASISQALANFALHFVPEVVRRHKGTLIYAGGDDVLALVPAAAALKCASELERVYRCEWNKDSQEIPRLLMGRRATVSAGVAVVHYKDDLRRALALARQAEENAKEGGRNALQLTVARRSGELTSVHCPWSFVDHVCGWVDIFGSGVSDRWAYQLRRLLPVAAGLEKAAIDALFERQVNRAELGDSEGITGSEAAEQFVKSWNEYSELTADQLSPGEQFREYVVMCQSASFLARGRDR